ncbi:hypothetical protein O181_008735 [Austropuccinia psidii MF-1]|uniref:Uncharacterized protein n=1 Tax=Austropuccinia psidii MF-1 TaxID=1389203 RepID=A0A9Q3BQI5_9BASI|nr:hypothetical protein [Austropuccinia psidii MF-1]
MKQDFKLFRKSVDSLIKNKKYLKMYINIKQVKLPLDVLLQRLKTNFLEIRILMKRRLIEMGGLNAGWIYTEDISKASESVEKVEGDKPLRAQAFCSVLGSLARACIAELFEILRIFQQSPELNYLNLNYDEIKGKLALEKCVFKAIDLLHKFKIASKEDLRDTFSSQTLAKANLQLIADHIRDIYGKALIDVTCQYYTLLPELEFITTDWKTAHLHNLLAALTPDEKAQLVYLVLVRIMEKWLDIRRSAASYEGDEVISDVWSAGLFELRSTLSSAGEHKDSEEFNKFASECVQKMMIFFQNYSSPRHKVSFLIIYHILHYSQTYKTSPEANFVSMQFNKSKLLEDEFKLLQIGLKMNLHINRWLDYGLFLKLSNKKRPFIPIKASQNSQEQLLITIEKLSEDYQNKKNEVFQNPQGRIWLNQNPLVSFLDEMVETKSWLSRVNAQSLWFWVRREPKSQFLKRVSCQIWSLKKLRSTSLTFLAYYSH